MGARASLIIASVIFELYDLTFLFLTQWLLYTSAFLVGVAAGCWWLFIEMNNYFYVIFVKPKVTCW